MQIKEPAFFLDSGIGSQLSKFPTSRYMGSKRQIWPYLAEVFDRLSFTSALDAFSGSGAVSYLLKTQGKSVTSNDFLTFCYHTANASIANSYETVDSEDIKFLLGINNNADSFIANTFGGLYFSEEENKFLDNLTANIREMGSQFKQSIAFSAIVRACMRKRPRGVFTYVGNRYDDGRKDLQLSMQDQFIRAIEIVNNSIFDNNQQNFAMNLDVFDIPTNINFDLVYIDTPYVSKFSDNDYTRRYHFVEGLTRYWKDLQILPNTETKKFKRIPSVFDNRSSVYEGFDRLFSKFKNSKLVVSYSSNGIPSKDEIVQILSKYKMKITVIEIDHKYSFGTHSHLIENTQNKVKEYVFIGE